MSPVIFISSVTAEFGEFRSRLARLLERTKRVHVRHQDDFLHRGVLTLFLLEEEIRSSTCVVHLIGEQTGWSPPSDQVEAFLARHPAFRTQFPDIAAKACEGGITATQWEAWLAKFFRVERLICFDISPVNEAGGVQRSHIDLLESYGTHTRPIQSREGLLDEIIPLLVEFGYLERTQHSGSLPGLSQDSDRVVSRAAIPSFTPRREEVNAYFRDYDVTLPFGGREAELRRLDNMLVSDAVSETASRTLIHGPAGTGKSSLLVHWWERLQSTDAINSGQLKAVFVPVSDRHGLSSPDDLYSILGWQLAAIYKQDAGPLFGPSAAPKSKREAIYHLLSGPPPENSCALIIVDGLDELVDPDVRTLFAPDSQRPWLKVVVSAKDFESQPAYWLQHLGWHDSSHVLRLPLSTLDEAGVRDVVSRTTLPSTLDRHVASRLLFNATAGYPLILGALLPYLQDETLAISLDDLQGEDMPVFAASGLDQVMQRFFTFIERIARREGEFTWNVTFRLLQVLAIARGGLEEDHWRRLACIESRESGFAKSAKRILASLVVGHGELIRFPHPEFARSFRDTQMDASDRIEVTDRFLDWGRSQILAEGPPEGIPQYVVRCLGEHLVHADHKTENERLELLHGLLDARWCAAWSALEGQRNYAGYLRDVRRVNRLAVTLNQQAAPTASFLPFLGTEIRCKLITASIASLSGNLEPELLVAALESELWTFNAVLDHISQIPDSSKQEAALSCLTACSSDSIDWTLVAGLADSLTNPLCRTNALVSILDRLSQDDAERVLNTALELALSIPCGTPDRGQALMRVAGKLKAKEALRIAEDAGSYRDYIAHAVLSRTVTSTSLPVDEAIGLAKGISDPESLCKVLAAISKRLSGTQCDELIARALAAAKMIHERWRRHDALVSLMNQLPTQEALEVARNSILNEGYRSEALVRIAYNALPSERSMILDEAIEEARKVHWDGGLRSRAFLSISEALPGEESLKMISSEISDPSYKISALISVVKRLPESQHRSVFRKAMVVARSLTASGESDALVRSARAVSQIAAAMPVEDALGAIREVQAINIRSGALASLSRRVKDDVLKRQIVQEAIDATSRIDDAYYQIRLLAKMRDQFAIEDLTAANQLSWKAAINSPDEEKRARAVCYAFETFPPNDCYFDSIKQIPNREWRVYGLSLVASRLPLQARRTLLNEALEVAYRIPDRNAKHRAFSSIARAMPADEVMPFVKKCCESEYVYFDDGIFQRIYRELPIDQAVDAVKAIREHTWKCEALAVLAARLPEKHKSEMLERAFSSARSASSSGPLCEGLVAMVPHLPNDLAEQVVEEALDRALQHAEPFSRFRQLIHVLKVMHGPKRAEVIEGAIQAAQDNADPQQRACHLAEIAALLSGERQRALVDEACRLTLHRDRDLWRGWTIREIVPLTTDWRLDEVLDFWHQIFEDKPFRREHMLDDLAIAAPLIPRLGGQDAVRATLHAVQEVGTRWP